jgi:hypothetical protein
LAVVPKNGAAAAQAARSVARDPRLPSWMQPSRLPGPPGPRIALCAAAFRPAAAGPRLLRLCRGAPGCGADHPKSAFAASSQHCGLGVLLLDGYSCLRSRLVGWTHFFLNCQNRLSEQANLDSKLKVEVCVRTGTKFVSEQGLRLNVRVSPWRLGGRAGCVLIESVRGSEGDFKTGRGKERGNWECQSP